MKKILSLALILIVLSSCNSNEKKAKIMIKEYLKTAMNDFSSYQPVEFSTLDSSFSTFYESKKGKKLTEDYINSQEYLMDSYERLQKFKLMDMSKEIIEVFQEIYDDANSRTDSLLDVKIKAEQSFQHEHIGYAMSHKFRGKNAFGAIMLNEYSFYFDKDLTKIADVIDIENRLDILKKILEKTDEE